MSLIDSWLFLVVIYDFGWFLVILCVSLSFLMVLGGSLKSLGFCLIIIDCSWLFLLFLVVLYGSLGFLIVFGCSWWFLVGISGCL